MKLTIALIAVATVATVASALEASDDYTFERFKNDFGKRYASSAEHARREQLFESRLQDGVEAVARGDTAEAVRHFESCLAANKTGSGYCFGTSVSYVDIALFHAYRATEAQWSSHFANIDVAVVAVIGSQDVVAA